MDRSVSLLLSTLLLAWGGCSEGPPAGVQSVATPDPPLNVILVTWDTVRADHVGTSDEDRAGATGSVASHTPIWDRLAREGIRFSEARTPVPITLPAHASMLSGLEPPGHGARDNGIFEVRGSVPLLGEELAAAGYETGAFVSAAVLNHRYGLERGFRHYDDLIAGMPGAQTVAARRGDETIDAALSWETGVPDDRPLFLWVHLFDPHREWQAPEPWRSRFDPYRAEIAFSDAHTGRLLEVLAARGRLERAIVVLTSDHGEGLGEHGERSHSYFAYDSTLRVPLLVWAGPRAGVELAAGASVAGPASLVDLAPTIRELTGLAARPSDGRSLVPFFDGAAVSPRDLPVESVAPANGYATEPVFGVVTAAGEAWYDGPTRERFALESDPRELQNLYGERDRERADALFARFPRDWPPASGALGLDAASRQRLSALGYVFGSQPGAGSAVERVDAKERVAVHRFLTRDHQRRDPEQVLAEAEALQREHGALPAIASFRVLLLSSEGRARDALALLEEAVAANPDHLPFQQELGVRRAAWQAAEANARELRAALEANPDDARLRRGLAVALHQLQEFDEAGALYREAYLADPDDHDSALNLALVLVAMGRRGEALAQIDAVLARGDYGIQHACIAGRLLALRLDRAEQGAQVLRECEAGGGELDELDRALLSDREPGPARDGSAG